MKKQSLDVNILIVDDEEDLIDTMGEYLADYNLVGAQTIDDALDSIDEDSIDLVITDVRLDEENGIDLLRSLQQRSTPVPVILISGFDIESMPVKALEERALLFLEKPFGKEELRRAVEFGIRHIVQNKKIRSFAS